MVWEASDRFAVDFRDRTNAALRYGFEAGLDFGRDYADWLDGEISGLWKRLFEEAFPNRRFSRRRESLLVLARGSYARREITLDSDIDLTLVLEPFPDAKDREIADRLIRDFSRELRGNFPGVNVQFAEAGELEGWLGNFREKGEIHALVSLLEARPVSGSSERFDVFSRKCREAVDEHRFIRFLLDALEDLPSYGLSEVHLKTGRGGLRHLNLATWTWRLLRGDEPSGTDGGKNPYCSSLWRLVEKEGRIDATQRELLTEALDFILGFRNFVGWRRFRSSSARPLDFPHENVPEPVDETLCRLFIEAHPSLSDADEFDRKRLRAKRSVEEFAGIVLSRLLGEGRTIRKGNLDLKLDYLGKEVVDFTKSEAGESKPSPSVSRRTYDDPDQILPLFDFLSQTDFRLGRVPRSALRKMLRRAGASSATDGASARRRGDFFFRLFLAGRTSNAMRAMMDIEVATEKGKGAGNLLGYFLPEAGGMVDLIRNPEAHYETVGEHSARALRNLERYAERLERQHDPLWRLLDDEAVFALKWATFFHDLGKVDPAREHEKHGAELALKMLVRLGFDEKTELFDKVNRLILNHQEFVKICADYLYVDVGITRFIELAKREPRMMVMLFLINHSDLKCLESENRNLLKRLERIYGETEMIVAETRGESVGKPDERVQAYLEKKRDEVKYKVGVSLLVRKLAYEEWSKGIDECLQACGEEKRNRLRRNEKTILEKISLLRLEGMDEKTKYEAFEKLHGIFKSCLDLERIIRLSSVETKSFSWFFNAFPNRYLLTENPGLLARHLFKLQNFGQASVQYSPWKTGNHESSVLFSFRQGTPMLLQFAFGLNAKGISIENGKVNRVFYRDGKEGFAGFFQLRHPVKTLDFDGLFSEITHLNENGALQGENDPLVPTTGDLGVDVAASDCHQAPYRVLENETGFSRLPFEASELRISLQDAPYCFYKILTTLISMTIDFHQITVTTQASRVSDYFYLENPLEADAKKRLAERLNESSGTQSRKAK